MCFSCEHLAIQVWLGRVRIQHVVSGQTDGQTDGSNAVQGAERVQHLGQRLCQRWLQAAEEHVASFAVCVC